MKKLVATLIVAAALAPVTTWAATNKGIIGSPHDFATASWNVAGGRSGVCSPCHAAHHTDNAQIAPLWVHETLTSTFIPYGQGPTYSGKMTTLPGSPSGPSLACLSCHDGSVAINQSMSGLVDDATGTYGTQYIDPSAQIGPDLHTTHPVSFVYDASLAWPTYALENPMTYKIGDAKGSLTYTTAPVPTSWSGIPLTGKTIDEAMLFNHKMECSSCHDVHKQDGSSPSSGIMTRISGSDANGRGSTLCRTCHVK